MTEKQVQFTQSEKGNQTHSFSYYSRESRIGHVTSIKPKSGSKSMQFPTGGNDPAIPSQ